jgi:hypothetical protein
LMAEGLSAWGGHKSIGQLMAEGLSACGGLINGGSGRESNPPGTCRHAPHRI